MLYEGMSNKIKIKKKLIIEGLLALFVAISPLLFYSYKYIPANSSDSWTFLGITFTNNGFTDVSVALYFYLSKLIPLALLVVWYITSKNWWYHVLLIPIAMYSFQLFNVISEDTKKIDENEILYLLAVCMVVIPIVYFIRVKLFDKHVHGIDLEAMDAELKAYREKEKLSSNKPYPFESNSSKTINGDNPNDQATSNSTKSDNFIELFQGKLEKLFDIKL